jgi:cytochrome c553
MKKLPAAMSALLFAPCVVLLTLIVGSIDAFAADSYAPCAACHGQQAEGNAVLRAPALAGLDEAYVLRQLLNFRDGVRGAHPDDKDGAVMRAAMAALKTEPAMREVIAVIKRFPAPSAPAALVGADLTAGRNYYNGICSACHGGKAEGNTMLNAPRLTGQSADYLNRQFQHFRSRVRGGHASDKYGAQMSKITKAIADDKLAADIAAYIVQLSRTR